MHKEMTVADLMLFICLLKKSYTWFAIAYHVAQYQSMSYYIISYHIISESYHGFSRIINNLDAATLCV